MSANPFVLGVVGDSGSGKNTIADSVATLLGPARITDLRLDDYHRFTREERAQRGITALNPVVHNVPLMQEHLQLLRAGRPIRNRSYEHAKGTFGPIRRIDPNDIVLVRGLLGYPTDQLRSLYDLAIFLQPEPELLFRWKLRRDVLSRGYTEPEVLKSIAHHLLDSKEFILPQVHRADLVVQYRLPSADAPDEQVGTVLLLRRRARAAVAEGDLLSGVGVEIERDHDHARIEIPAELTWQEVEAWGRARFPATFDRDWVGVYLDDTGERRQRAPLAMVEVLVAALTEALRAERMAAPG